MGSPAIRLALAAGLPVFLAGKVLAQDQRAPLPSASEVGRALASSLRCVDRDGYTLCNPEQPVGATFSQLLCAETGSDLEHHPIARCVYRGARLELVGRIVPPGGSRTRFRDYGDGAIDLINVGTWVPNAN